MQGGKLSEQDHNLMDSFLVRILDAYKNGDVTRERAISGLAHVMAALDQGNSGEAVSWFKQKGVSFFQDAG